MYSSVLVYFNIFMIIGVLILILLGIFNKIIKCENQIKNSFSAIDVAFKKRYDLIPNLVESVKGYMEYEKELLEEVTKLRSERLSLNQQIEFNESINTKLNSFYAVSEDYPELKANELFAKLTQNLIIVENELAAARRAYNSSVLRFNNMIMTFPGIIYAKFMHKKEYKMFEVEINIRENISINLNK